MFPESSPHHDIDKILIENEYICNFSRLYNVNGTVSTTAQNCLKQPGNLS